jgi:hypothetical protein
MEPVNKTKATPYYMNTMSKESTPGGSETRKPGYYWVCWHHSTDWFIAQWLGAKWAVADEYGGPEYFKDAHFDFIDERPIVRAARAPEMIAELTSLREENARLREAQDKYDWMISVMKSLDSFRDDLLTHASVFYNEKHSGLNVIIKRYGLLWNWIIEDHDFTVPPELFAKDLINDTRPTP